MWMENYRELLYERLAGEKTEEGETEGGKSVGR